MTDAQLSVLLYQYATRLTQMIAAAESGLPDDGKTPRRTYMPKEFGGAEWRETPLLDDLRAFAQELKQDSELLELAAREDKPKR